MEKNKKSHLWYLLLLLPFGFILPEGECSVLPGNSCSTLPPNLSCYNDYNRSIHCVWNSTHEHQDAVCIINAERIHKKYTYSNSCQLQSDDASRPMQKKCTMLFKVYRFLTDDLWRINISCNTKEQVLSIDYKPRCHIKLNPPPKPEVNITTVVWFAQVTSHMRITHYIGQLQLRQQGQPWMHPPLVHDCSFKGPFKGKDNCTLELPDDLIKGKNYEARIRVKTSDKESTWSDWSPSEEWTATVGREKPTPAPTSEALRTILGTLVCLVLFVLTIILIRTDRTTWIYIVKRLRGPPLPHPGKSFLQDVDFKSLKNTPFTSESFHEKQIEIAQVEVTSSLNAVTPSELQAMLQGMLTVKSGHPSNSSSFSNPIYSHLCPLPSALLLTAGTLKPCDSDTPYAPVGCPSDDKDGEQDEESEILRLLSEGKCEETIVSSDYEKVERVEVDRVRLQSLDSGVCSAEEVSQESLEPDSITKAADEHGSEIEEEENDFLKLFRGGGVLDKGSIQVCSGYEQIQKMPNDTSELLSLDSSISSGCGPLANHGGSLTEDDDDDNKRTESMLLLCSPHAPVLRCSSSASLSLPLDLPGADFGGSGEILEKTALMSLNRAISGIEPSADEYLPVRWELKIDVEKL